MSLLINKEISEIIVPETINYTELVKHSNTTQSLNIQSKMIQILNEEFTETEQHWYVANLYIYMHYHPINDYLINLENIFKMLGFANKSNAKKTLVNNFTINEDYKVIVPREYNLNGGRPTEEVMLNTDTFKNLCMLAKTEKGKEIRKYYVKLENINNKLIIEELKESQENTIKLLEHLENTQNELENKILQQFPGNTQCIYVGSIENTNSKKQKLIKFGSSNFLCDRVKQHKKTFTNFRLINAYKCENKTTCENGIKQHPILKKKRCSILVNNENQTELLVIDDLDLDKLDGIIKEIIMSIEYNPQNYTKMMEELIRVKKENHILLQKKRNSEQQLEQHPVVVSVINEFPLTTPLSVRKYERQRDGLYHIEGKPYRLLTGTREEVWKEEAYRTAGLLLKNDLMIGNHNKVVSKNKCIASTLDNRLNKNDNRVNNIRQFKRESDGLYHIEDKTYRILTGTKEEVFSGIAYRTIGLLKKEDLTIGESVKTKGKVISMMSYNRYKNSLNKDDENVKTKRIVSVKPLIKERSTPYIVRFLKNNIDEDI